MKKRFKIIGIIGVIGLTIAIALSIWLYISPKKLGNISHTYAEPETSVSDIKFQGEEGDKIKFSFSSHVANGCLDIVIYDSQGSVVKELDKADRLEVL